MRLGALAAQIERECRHLTNGASSSSPEFRLQAALAVLARVPVLLSPAIYSADLAAGVAPVGVANTLAQGSGVCGNQVELALEVFAALGVPARDVQVFYGGSEALNHTVVEVAWADDWHMVDVTYGFLPHAGTPISALSFDAARQRGTAEGLHHTLVPWRLATEANFDIFGYLAAPAEATLYDGRGDVRVAVGSGSAALPHPPWLYTVGPKRHYRSVVDAEVVVDVGPGTTRLHIAGNAGAPTTLIIGTESLSVAGGPFDHTVDVVGPAALPIRVDVDAGAALVEISGIAGDSTP